MCALRCSCCCSRSLQSLLPFNLAADSPKPADLILIQKGTLPIIVSAPHGGRTGGAGGAGADRRGDSPISRPSATPTPPRSRRLSLSSLKSNSTASRGWLWRRFDRKYVDANRSAEEGYESQKAKPTYDAYHAALVAACKAVKQKHGCGLLLDIHGQGEFKDAICRGTRNGKTVALLLDRDGRQAMTGKRSVLGHLQRNGYRVLPSCDADEKAREEAKFNGGHIVDTYGSHTGYAIDAIQLEFGTTLRAKDRHATTARDLAAAVAVFHDEYLAARK